MSQIMALPVNDYLDAVIIIQLSIKLPLLADAQTGLATFSTTVSAAQRHRMGNSTLAYTCPDTQYPEKPLFKNFSIFLDLFGN